MGAEQEKRLTKRLSPGKMPRDFVFVRHGESEANVVQQAEYRGEIHEMHEDIANRPDWQQRLTAEGVKQAKATGKWIDKNLGGANSFDGCFVSPFMRTRETAAYIGGDHWIIDDRIIERFRGVYGVVSSKRLIENGKELLNMRDTSPWYARIDGSESLQDVFSRFRAFQRSIKRNYPGRRILVVAHGDFLKVAQYSIEWMVPEVWQDLNKDLQLSVGNGWIIHYSRVNPSNPTDFRDVISWKRVINPLSEKDSPNSGKWQELSVKRMHKAEDLLEMAEKIPPMLDR